jgi:ATP synthase protein I
MKEERGMPSEDRPGADDPPETASSPSSVVNVGSYAALGVQFVLSILVFLYLGRWVDRKLGTEPWFLFIGVFTGATAGFYAMYRKLTADQKREEASKARARRP